MIDKASFAARARVLVVDDNEDSADMLATLLDTLGCEVRAAYDGVQGLAVAETFAPSLILLDVGLPLMDGIAVCKRLREQSWGKDTFVVAMTGWGRDEDRRETEAAGFDMHLVKPIDPKQLTSVLADHAERTKQTS